MVSEINWIGPYSIFPKGDIKSIFNCEDFKLKGVYLWTIKHDNSYLVNYVGITSKSFIERLIEHLNNYYSGKFDIYDSKSFLKGIKHKIYSPLESLSVFLEKYDYLS